MHLLAPWHLLHSCISHILHVSLQKLSVGKVLQTLRPVLKLAQRVKQNYSASQTIYLFHSNFRGFDYIILNGN